MKKLNAQEWLGRITNKDKITSMGRNNFSEATDEFWKLKDDEDLEGELKIDDFPNLQSIELKGKSDKGFLNKVSISNCPKLQKVNLFNNVIDELNVSNLINLRNLTVSKNNLGKINVKGCKKLQSIITFSKRIISDEAIKEEWEGLEDLESLVLTNTDYPFLPIKELKNWKEVSDPDKGLDILNSEGIIDEDKVKKYKEAKGGPTSEELKKLTTQRDELQTKLTTAETELTKWNSKFLGETPEEVAQKLINANMDKNKFKDKLSNWNGKFPDKTPEQVENEIKELKTKLTNVDNIINSALKKLNTNNLNSLPQLPTGETVNSLLQRPTQQQLQGKDSQIGQLTNAKNLVDRQLNNWNSKFPNRTAEQVENEIQGLKSRPIGTILTAEQQRKLNNFDRLQTHSDRQKGLIDGMSEHMRKNGLMKDEFENQVLDLGKYKP